MKGNCDHDVDATRYGQEDLGEIGRIGKIAACHGNKPEILERLVKSSRYRYVLTGHTHKVMDERVGKTRVLNPGGHKQGDENIIILDTEKDVTDFIFIGGV